MAESGLLISNFDVQTEFWLPSCWFWLDYKPRSQTEAVIMAGIPRSEHLISDLKRQIEISNCKQQRFKKKQKNKNKKIGTVYKRSLYFYIFLLFT